MHVYTQVIRSKRREQAAGSKLGPDLISRFLDDAAKKNETITDEARPILATRVRFGDAPV